MPQSETTMDEKAKIILPFWGENLFSVTTEDIQ